MIYLKEVLTPMPNEYNDLQINSAKRGHRDKIQPVTQSSDSDKEKPTYKLVHSAPIASFNDFHVSSWKIDKTELVDLLQSFSEHSELTLMQLKEKIVETVISPFLEAKTMKQYRLNPLTRKQYTDTNKENFICLALISIESNEKQTLPEFYLTKIEVNFDSLIVQQTIVKLSENMELNNSKENQNDYYVQHCKEQGDFVKHEFQSKWKQLSKTDFLEDKDKTRLMEFGIQSQLLSFEIWEDTSSKTDETLFFNYFLKFSKEEVERLSSKVNRSYKGEMEWFQGKIYSLVEPVNHLNFYIKMSDIYKMETTDTHFHLFFSRFSILSTPFLALEAFQINHTPKTRYYNFSKFLRASE